MAEEELYVLLSKIGVDKDEDFIAWREKNQDVEVVSAADARSKLEEKKPTKLTLIFTKFEKFDEFQRKFKSSCRVFEKIPDFSLQKLHDFSS
jgi:hypothetical protein